MNISEALLAHSLCGFIQAHLMALCSVSEVHLTSSVKMKCYGEKEDKGKTLKVVVRYIEHKDFHFNYFKYMI